MNRILLPICLFIFTYTAYTQEYPVYKVNIEDVINSSNIIRTSYVDTPVVNLYQGNGRFGCSYGPLGLHNNPEKVTLSKHGKTQFFHMEHAIRTEVNTDGLYPLAKMYWKDTPPSDSIRNYKQYQSLYEGTLLTHFEYEENEVKVITWFDPVYPDLAGITIDVTGKPSDIIFEPFSVYDINYQTEVPQSVEIKKTTDSYKIILSCFDTKSEVYLKTNATIKLKDTKLILSLQPGKNKILLSVNNPIKISSDKSLEQTKKWWENKWNNTGLVVLPDSTAQNMWVRSMYQFLSTYNNDTLGLTPPCGFTGNKWVFNFPQDVSYIHPVLLATGHVDIAKSWIEYISKRTNEMKTYTQLILNEDVDGVLCPWSFPYKGLKNYHEPTPPNKFYFAIHNSGYLARMAYETAAYVNNDEWTKKFAIPIIKETAEFYKSIAYKGEDELWHLYVTPSIGQDENGGVNQEDYLCALFSAKYCFQKAIEYNLGDGSYQEILDEGLAFSTLLSAKGYYYTCRGTGEKDFGKQKHPVQLNDLAFLPVYSYITEPSRRAYNMRYQITYQSDVSRFWGWTPGEFLLASSRIGDVKGWQKDWKSLSKSGIVDPEWIQVYESVDTKAGAFYTTTNGLITQSILSNLVSDWFGKLEIAKCKPWKGKVVIKNVSLLTGITVDGVINENNSIIGLTAWKDCEFELYGNTINMKENETLRLKLNTGTKSIISIQII